jgi:cell division protein FtsI/penicillin-binding protein 2
MRRRISIVLFLIIIFGATIVGRLIDIQILKHDYYKAFAKGQQKLFQSVEPNRGDIFAQDKNGDLYILATNKDSRFVFISPSRVENEEKVTAELSVALNLEKELILEKISQRESLFVAIKSKLTKEEIERIEELNLTGVYLDTEIYRYYPEENLASHVLGFVGGKSSGQYGLEGFYEPGLRGEEGLTVGERSSKGRLIFLDSQKSISAEEGVDLVLGIDYYIQLEAEKLLRIAQEDLDIEDGQIVVINPSSGKIITAASLLSFNPNQYFDYNLEIFMDPLSQKIFEPGSVFKPITMAAAIEEGELTPQTTYIDEGFVKIGPDTIYNYAERVYGQQTMTEVLEKSINTGAVFAEQRISHSVFLDYIEEFGVFEKTGIDLQGEVFSTNEELKKGYEINFATAAFGQGIEMTPIQLIRAFSVFANGGKLVKPYLVEKIIKSDGAIVDTQPEVQNSQVISRSTASKLTAMLVSVVEHGFGKKAKVPGYYIPGKTGTSQVSWSALGISKAGYSDKTVQTFIGFAPAFNPRFLILVKLDNPKTRTAEYSAVPVFHNLAKYIIDYYQIPPDYED